MARSRLPLRAIAVDWFAQQGIGFEPRAVNHIQIDPSYVAIEAAVNGVGVVLESGILEQQRPTVAYWLLPLRSDARRATHIAYDWLLDQSNCKH